MPKDRGSSNKKYGPCPKCGFGSDHKSIYESHFVSDFHKGAVF